MKAMHGLSSGRDSSGDAHWPFSALLPGSIIYNYPLPQTFRPTGLKEPHSWPPPVDRALQRWVEETCEFAASAHQVYVHVPFCDFTCGYCPFYKLVGSNNFAERRQAYVDAVVKEIQLYAASAAVKERRYTVIYFGGGTPTVLTPQQLAQILAALRNNLNVAENAEITLEGIARHMAQGDYLAECYALGINRITFGVQSLDPVVRRAINRVGDDVEDYPSAVATSRSLNPAIPVNVEFLIGCPDQDVASVQNDLEQAISWQPSSIDAFSYVMFPDTRLYKMIISGQRNQPHWGRELLQMRAASRRLLVENGYAQHCGEGFSKGDSHGFATSFRSGGGNAMHVVLPLGPSAIGRLAGVAYRNVADLTRYMQAIRDRMLPIASCARMTAETARLRALMLGLAELRVPRLFVKTAREHRLFKTWAQQGLVDQDSSFWRVTGEGSLWFNQMQFELMPLRDLFTSIRLAGSIEDQQMLISRDTPLGQELIAAARRAGGIKGSASVFAYRTFLKIAKRLPKSARHGIGWLGYAK